MPVMVPPMALIAVDAEPLHHFFGGLGILELGGLDLLEDGVAAHERMDFRVPESVCRLKANRGERFQMTIIMKNERLTFAKSLHG